jgi:hypothetical protein
MPGVEPKAMQVDIGRSPALRIGTPRALFARSAVGRRLAEFRHRAPVSVSD